MHIGKTHKANAKTKFCQRAFQPFPRRSRHKTNIAVKLKMTNTKHDKSRAYKVHIAGRVRWYANCGFSHRSSVSSRTGTLFEIRPDNMYQPLTARLKNFLQHGKN
jgi:hypothetical protein